MQHGPLITFHLNLTQGNAVVRYSSKEEAAKAQKSLHMYLNLFIILFISSHSQLFDHRHFCLVLFLLCFQVCSGKHHYTGRVCWRRGGEPLLCTGSIPNTHHQLAGQPWHQSNAAGRRRDGGHAPHWPLE